MSATAGFEELTRLGEGPGRALIVCPAAEEPPYYRGLNRPGASTIFEVLASAVPRQRQRYREIYVLSGIGPQLPAKRLGTATLGTNPCGWIFMGKTGKTGKPQDAGRFTDRAPLDRVDRNLTGMSWLDRLEQILQVIESRAGVEWKFGSHEPIHPLPAGRTLVLVDVSLLLKGTDDNCRDLDRDRRNELGTRFNRVPELCKECTQDVLVFCRDPCEATGLATGMLLAVSKTNPETHAYEGMIHDPGFPQLHWQRAETASISPVDSVINYSLCFDCEKREDPKDKRDVRAKEVGHPGMVMIGDKCTLSAYEILTRRFPQVPADPLQKIQRLVGMQEIGKFLEVIREEVEDRKRNITEGIPLGEITGFNVVIEGNPGTGKTTVAELVGEILADLGAIPSRKITKCTPSDLIGEYIGQSGPKAKNQCVKALGGLMIIDEAYSLGIDPAGQDSRRDFKKESITEMLVYMENEYYRDKIVFAFLGYPGTYESLCKTNQGFRRRIYKCIVLRDYTNPELCTIARQMATKSGDRFADGADKAMTQRFDRLRENLGSQFGNGGAARSLLVASQERRKNRLRNTPGGDASIRPEDILSADLNESVGKTA
jgi:hypothetical protein